MLCHAPIGVWVERFGRRYLERVRCGQCRPCRIRRKQAWTGRLMLEGMEHQVSRFLTLTYAEDPGILDYSDFQLFMKRYREANGPCRFFAVGEYGEIGGRGHWHAIIFGHPQVFLGKADIPQWGHGYSFDGSASPAAMGYVSGYVLKKEIENRQNVVRCSLKPGIGMRAIDAFARSAARTALAQPLRNWPGRIRIGGRAFPITDGALEKFKSTFIKEGGLPPREDDPDERHYLNMYAMQGDAFFDQRVVRDNFRRYELGLDNGTKTVTRGTL